MSENPSFTINPDERFEHLLHAPIVEAVIEFRARAEASWEEASLRLGLSEAISDYPTQKKIVGGAFTTQFKLRAGVPEAETPSTQHNVGWLGIRAESDDRKQIAAFTRDGLSFSHLTPYEDWDHFQAEALRLWEIHKELARPSQIQRLGVRFINRLEVPIVEELDLGDYFNQLGEPPGDFLMAGFLRQDLLVPRGYPYRVNVIRTLESPTDPTPTKLGLLLDITAFCSEPIDLQMHTITQRLADLHWLKNKVFFSTLTEKALDLCR